jgi:uncharacterized protein
MENRVTAIVEALRGFDPDKIYLFGSWAQGEQDELSDVDLFIIKETELGFLERMREAARRLPLELGAVDLLVHTPGEFERMLEASNAFALMIKEEGRLVYARGKEA